jgi:hypothetical protein
MHHAPTRPNDPFDNLVWLVRTTAIRAIAWSDRERNHEALPRLGRT